MPKHISLSALPLAVLVLFPIAGAQADERPMLLAQAEPPQQAQEGAPSDNDAEHKGRKGRKRDREDGAPPNQGAKRPPPGANAEGPPARQKATPGQNGHKKAAGEAPPAPHGLPPGAFGEKKRPSRNEGPAGKPPAEPPVRAQAPAAPPAAKMQAPAEAEAPAGPPSVPPQEPRRRKQAQPRGEKQPEQKQKMRAAPAHPPHPEAPREPVRAAAPPPEAPPKPQVTKSQGPTPQDKSAPQPHRAAQPGFAGGNMENIKRQRRQRTEDGGTRTVIEEPGNRVIVKEGGEARIRHDETERLRRTSRDVRREKRKDGTNVTIALRPGGIEIYSEFDADGRLLRRYRRGRDGRETNLIDNRRFRGSRHHHDRNGFGFYVDLRPPRIGIPRDRYIVEYDRASEDDVYDALMAPPVEELDRGYSLDEIRYSRNLRDRMRRIDLDTVNFAFGSWEVAPSQYDKLARVARVINRILDRRPDEIFLVEGHTDAVGSDIDNLTLSDRRAEEVAYILTEHFEVPPENLVTQGYGEQYLKIDTPEPERANRRVAMRRITPLMARR